MAGDAVGVRVEVATSIFLLTLAVALRNCVFLGVSALLGVSAFYRFMDAAVPGYPMRAAMRCIVAGVVAIVISLLALLALLTGAFGLWPSVNTTVLMAGAMVAAIAIVLRSVLGAYLNCAVRFVPVHIMIVGPATLALALAANGAGWIACLYAGAALAIVGTVGWHLARDTASELMRSAAER